MKTPEQSQFVDPNPSGLRLVPADPQPCELTLRELFSEPIITDTVTGDALLESEPEAAPVADPPAGR